jgi:restriction system protein
MADTSENVNLSRRGQLRQGLLSLLAEHPDGLQARDALAALAKRVPPTDWESQDYPKRPGDRRYEKIVRFRTIALVKAGWMTKTGGVWAITTLGEKALKAFPNPSAFSKEVERLYDDWASAQPKVGPAAESELVESGSVALEEAEEQARVEIDAYLHKMNPYDFQQLVAGLLEGMGYHVAWVSPPGADGGVDILAYTDPLGTQGPRIKVQVKRIGDKVDLDKVKSFTANLGPSDVGIYVALAGFTKTADDYARQLESKRMTLLDLGDLFDLWVEHYKDIPEERRNLLPLRPVYYLATT